MDATRHSIQPLHGSKTINLQTTRQKLQKLTICLCYQVSHLLAKFVFHHWQQAVDYNYLIIRSNLLVSKSIHCFLHYVLHYVFHYVLQYALHYVLNYRISDIVKPLIIKTAVFWNVTPCGLVDSYERFGETSSGFRMKAE